MDGWNGMVYDGMKKGDEDNHQTNEQHKVQSINREPNMDVHAMCFLHRRTNTLRVAAVPYCLLRISEAAG